MKSLVSTQGLLSLPEHEVQLMQQKLADPLYLKFIRTQRDAAKDDVFKIVPRVGMNPQAFFELSKEAHLVLQFWSDFLIFAEEWGISRSDII